MLFLYAAVTVNYTAGGVIYRCTTGTGIPLFGLRGTVPSTKKDEKVKNLLSQSCCQQRRSAEIKLQ